MVPLGQSLLISIAFGLQCVPCAYVVCLNCLSFVDENASHILLYLSLATRPSDELKLTRSEPLDGTARSFIAIQIRFHDHHKN